MPLLLMQIVEGPRVLKQWFGKSIQETFSVTDMSVCDTDDYRPQRNQGNIFMRMMAASRTVWRSISTIKW